MSQAGGGLVPVELVKKAGNMTVGSQQVRSHGAGPHDCPFEVDEPNLKSLLLGIQVHDGHTNGEAGDRGD